MKVCVVSNCQGESFAACMQAMNAGFDAKFILSTQIKEQINSSDILDECEIIFTQPALKSEISKQYERKIVLFPNIVFSGFHPDMTYAVGETNTGKRETILGPMYSYHSAIALQCYKLGIPLADTLTFYNAYVFGKLGFFEQWETARQELLDEGTRAGLPLHELFEKWSRRGHFMYSFNHPELHVVADVVRSVLKTIGIPAVSGNPDQYLNDPLRAMPIWPIYPEIGLRHGIPGDYTFIFNHSSAKLSLEDFVRRTYETYDGYKPGSIQPLNFSMDDYNRKLGFSGPVADTEVPVARNPYASVPKTQFWRQAVAEIEPARLDPVVSAKFRIHPTDKVATAGSCFAQHIARTLSKNGFNYFIAENAPDGMDVECAQAENYGVFSARYGNIYTVRQLVQLIDRAEKKFVPVDHIWSRPDGRYVDPFRPQISKAGFGSLQDLQLDQEAHFSSVLKLLKESDVFVFTLGLTEGWRSKLDGAVFPLAPGVAGGQMDFERYEFVNFNYDEVLLDLLRFIDRMSLLNPECKLLLTVSPVPLIATYEPRHALVSTTYSKSVLRAVADEVSKNNAKIAYFPSYEIITGTYNKGKYFENDLREVTDSGVSHVMGLFMQHYAESPTEAMSMAEDKKTVIQADTRPSRLFQIVCDEEMIANSL